LITYPAPSNDEQQHTALRTAVTAAQHEQPVTQQHTAALIKTRTRIPMCDTQMMIMLLLQQRLMLFCASAGNRTAYVST
jgi:hypothetical protein